MKVLTPLQRLTKMSDRQVRNSRILTAIRKLQESVRYHTEITIKNPENAKYWNESQMLADIDQLVEKAVKYKELW